MASFLCDTTCRITATVANFSNRCLAVEASVIALQIQFAGVSYPSKRLTFVKKVDERHQMVTQGDNRGDDRYQKVTLKSEGKETRRTFDLISDENPEH
jgi:hypothetical protein